MIFGALTWPPVRAELSYTPLVDAARLLGLLRPLLDRAAARWMLAGGFAMAAWGSTRTTVDLDIAVDEKGREQLLPLLSSAGFDAFFDGEGFTNLEHPDPDLGRLDLMWVEGRTSEQLFESAVERPGPDGRPILAPAPRHLIAMKVRAIQSRPSRALRDAPDIHFLLGLPGLEENQVRVYFERAGLLELYRRLKAGG